MRFLNHDLPNSASELRFRLKSRFATQLWDYAGPFATFEEAAVEMKSAPDGDYLITNGDTIVWPQVESEFSYN